MSYPTDLIASYGEQGADLTMFSAKYFWGPNAGGFVYGTRELIDMVAQIDFTRFESGKHLIFGRAFKMDRAPSSAPCSRSRSGSRWITTRAGRRTARVRSGSPPRSAARRRSSRSTSGSSPSR